MPVRAAANWAGSEDLSSRGPVNRQGAKVAKEFPLAPLAGPAGGADGEALASLASWRLEGGLFREKVPDTLSRVRRW
jgi:hypothetical protein